jgi:hypothetical protein
MTLLITEELSEGDKSNHYLEAVRVLSCYSEIRREAVIWGMLLVTMNYNVRKLALNLRPVALLTIRCYSYFKNSL